MAERLTNERLAAFEEHARTRVLWPFRETLPALIEEFHRLRGDHNALARELERARLDRDFYRHQCRDLGRGLGDLAEDRLRELERVEAERDALRAENDELRRRLWAAAVATKRLDDRLSHYLHHEDCPLNPQEYEHGPRCEGEWDAEGYRVLLPDGTECDGAACWRGVPCECAAGVEREGMAAIEAALCGEGDGGSSG